MVINRMVEQLSSLISLAVIDCQYVMIKNHVIASE